MKLTGEILRADEGKVLRRKNTDEIYGEEVVLGYTYYINGELQNPPHKDTVEDFEEIEAENTQENEEQ